jgi:hypothetical protein
MSTMGGVPRRGFRDLVSAVIEEAWRRARRRRLIYAGIVLSLAVIGAVVTATLRGPSSSSSTPAAVASPGTPVSAVAGSAHTTRHHYHLYPGDTVDVGGGPHFDWSCTLYRLGPSFRHALGNRIFECRGGAEWTRAKPHLLLRTVVFQDGLLVQRGYKTIYGVDR